MPCDVAELPALPDMPAELEQLRHQLVASFHATADGMAEARRGSFDAVMRRRIRGHFSAELSSIAASSAELA